jgi:hypothetical protein
MRVADSATSESRLRNELIGYTLLMTPKFERY